MSNDALSTRPPARAGQFYPGEPARMNAAVDEWLALADTSAVRACRAVMLPHAGWLYCGATIGKTLGAVEVPATVIVIGPRHRQLGAPWSIAPHAHWDIPGGRISIAMELVARLTRLEPRLTPEPDAHRLEHGTEVLLPFLYRRNPRLRAVPIVLGSSSRETAAELGLALAEVVSEVPGGVLLVISSDMNHFGTDAENRRLDGMALEAMCTGEPTRLHETVRDHDISMCGVLPAVAVMEALRARTPTIAPEVIDYRTSGDASGDRDRVVGYAGVVIP